MTDADLGGRLAVLERQVGIRKAGEILSLENRFDVADRLADQHDRAIRQNRYEAVCKSAGFEKRIRALERLIVVLAELLIAIIAAGFACFVSARIQGGDSWLPRSGWALFAFLASFLTVHFIFRRLTISYLK